jgi:hypothetical protein
MSILSAMRSRTIAVLALICVALALLAVGELQASPSPPSSDSPARSLGTPVDREAAATLSPSPPVSLPSLQSFASVTDRPLFSPNRQPAKVHSGESNAWSSFVLAGIIITPELCEAMVLHNQPPLLVAVHEGDAIDGWTLESLFPDHAVFRNDAEERELKLNLVAKEKIPAVPGPTNTSFGPRRTPPPEG